MKAYILEGFGFRLAFLSFLLLGAASPAYAGQSGAPPPSTNVAAPAVAPATAAKLATPAGQTAAAGAPAAKGNHEGIKVHGHWTIEVRNPDGTVVTHREFENSLEQPSGGQIIANILSGTSVPGEFAVLLPVTCVSPVTFCVISSIGGAAVGGVIVPSNVTAAFGGALEDFCLGAGTIPGACPQTLQVSASGGSVILNGSVVAVAAGSVGGVTTSQARCTNSSLTLTGCLQQNGDVEPLTGTTITPAITYSANQTIAVTVMISFQ